jgi:hypothetical protein
VAWLTRASNLPTTSWPAHRAGFTAGRGAGEGVGAVALSLPRARSRTAGTWAVALATAASGWAASGLLAAVPAAAGLAVVAVSDLTTHRFSVRTLGVSSAMVAAALTADAAATGSWHHLAVAGGGTAALSVLLLVIWLVTAGVAFGDLLLGVFTLVVPLYLSLTSAAITVVVALAAAAGFVIARAARSGPSRSTMVPLAPALLVGWLCGVVAG